MTGDRGSSNIEMAILFPVFVLLILLGVQVANIFYGRTVALAAAQQGAAAQSAYGAPAGAGEARASAYLTRMGDVLTNWEVTVTPIADGGAEPTGVRVTVSGTTLGWLGMKFHVTQTAYSPIERFTTESDP
jgi:Flp pilus assembly protein TadG